MADSLVDEWHSRDLDAKMIQREVDAVEEWIISLSFFPFLYNSECFLHFIFKYTLNQYQRAHSFLVKF